MNKEIKAVVFDMDGVIFDTERIYQNCWKSEGADYNIGDIQRLYCKMMGASSDEIEKLFKNEYGNDFPFQKYRAQVKSKINEIIETNGLPFKNGVMEILEFLKENHIPVALATSTSRPSVESHLKRAGIKEYFDYIVTGDEVSKCKPDPEIYLKACRGIGVEPQFAIAIEDSFNGIRSAFRAGMKTVMIPDTVMPDDEIIGMLYGKFNNLLEVVEFLMK